MNLPDAGTLCPARGEGDPLYDVEEEAYLFSISEITARDKTLTCAHGSSDYDANFTRGKRGFGTTSFGEMQFFLHS